MGPLTSVAATRMLDGVFDWALASVAANRPPVEGVEGVDGVEGGDGARTALSASEFCRAPERRIGAPLIGLSPGSGEPAQRSRRRRAVRSGALFRRVPRHALRAPTRVHAPPGAP